MPPRGRKDQNLAPLAAAAGPTWVRRHKGATLLCMNDFITSMLLGLIEGLTEFLPVSSTGHLLLAEHFLPAQSDLFNTVIQSGAVCAVLVLFHSRVRALITTLGEPKTQAYVGQLALAFAITAVGGLILKKMHFKLPETTAPVAWATLIGGVLFVVVELILARRGTTHAQAQNHAHDAAIGWPVAVAMGCGQLIAAIFPGASRSGTTILLALGLGASRPQAAEFSFLLGIPTLLAAGGVQALGAVQASEGPILWSHIAVAAITAACVAFVVVRWLLGYVQRHSFIVFGLYRIVLGGLMLALG